MLDGTTAHAWGLKPGMVTVMVHTGSVSIGHLSGGHYRDVVRELYPHTLKHPDNGIFSTVRERAKIRRFPITPLQLGQE